MNNQRKWKIESEIIQACNCDYGCASPTKGFCEGMGAWQFTRGHYGEVRLDGLGVGFAGRWPKAIHEGSGTCGLLVDQRATPAQRETLIQICSGQAGGLPFDIMASTFTNFLEPRYAPFQFHFNGRNGSVQIGEAMNIAVEPIKNPVTGEPESVRLQHSTGFVFKEADCVSAAKMDVNVGELKFS